MSATVVLKFGGSVLRTPLDLERCVHEVYRQRRRGQRVVAVVSALSGRTDALWAEAGDADGWSTAAFVALGEAESAARLGLALSRAGLGADVLDAGAVQVEVSGDPCDARAVRLDRELVEAALARSGIAVLPGYVGRNTHGRAALLGRGGSDLSVLFIAEELGAEHCVLVKDVDGLYERDPRECFDGAVPPRRYASVTYADAERLDDAILQRKALEFARDRGRSFEVRGLQDASSTRIGEGATSFDAVQGRSRPLRVALLGLGTVGTEVARGLLSDPARFEVIGALVRDPSRPRGVDVSLTDDPEDLFERRPDLIVELIGGLAPAGDLVTRALERGCGVVTANKALIAECGDALQALARRRGTRLSDAAAVGGAVPILEALDTWGDQLRSLRGVLNGTCQSVLGQCRAGVQFEAAVEAAQRQGFAEADPSRDLDGRDTWDKLQVIAQRLGAALPDGPTPEAVDGWAAQRALCEAQAGLELVQVAELERTPAGLRGSVTLQAVAPGDPLHGLRGAENAAVLELQDGRRVQLRGRGAGGRPTAEAVLADLYDQARGRSRREVPRVL